MFSHSDSSLPSSHPRCRAVYDRPRRANFENAGRFSRKVWGLLSLELWHQIFHDRADRYRRMLAETPGEEMALAAGAGQ